MFSDRLKDLRQDADLKQDELARAIGVSPNTISKYESSDREPSFDILIKIADYFDVSLDYLLGRTNIKTPHFIINEIDIPIHAKAFDYIMYIIRKNIKSVNFICSMLKLLEENNKL